MTQYFIIPGYQGSGPEHWQTWMESLEPNFNRIEQRDFNAPDMDEWTANIDKAIEVYNPQSVVLVAHSLGCLTVAEWARRYKRKIKAALLVAPPDAGLISEKLNKKLFATEPINHIPFCTTLIASSNDHWISLDKARMYAQHWGSEFVNIGKAGHINVASGHGKWEQGYELLKRLTTPNR